MFRHGQANRFDPHQQELALGPVGQQQAAALAGLDVRPRRALASPALRCRQTLAPLAEAHQLDIEVDERLGEFDEEDHWDDLLAGLEVDTAICTHGPQVKRLGHHVVRAGLGEVEGEPEVAAGWRLVVEAGRLAAATRIQRPEPT